MKKEERTKAIAIPLIHSSDGKPPRFLTVKDRRYQEWTFVTGGCRKKEVPNPLYCALRELEEETRGAVNLKSGTFRYFNFNHSVADIHSNSNISIDITYHVYLIDFHVNKHEQSKLINKFNDAKMNVDHMKRHNYPIRLVYDENDVMNFETLNEFSSKEKVWELIRKNILDNPEFYKVLNTEKRQNFNMCIRQYQ